MNGDGSERSSLCVVNPGFILAFHLGTPNIQKQQNSRSDAPQFSLFSRVRKTQTRG